MTMKRATNKQIIDAYKQTGSVWAAGKLVGLCGQSVWERLKAIGHPLQGGCWTPDEITALRDLAGRETIGHIARTLGRPYYGVACMISKLGLSSWYHPKTKERRRPTYPKRETLALIRDLRNYGGSIRSFARSRGLGLDAFVLAIQRHDASFWGEYAASKGLPERTCYCGVVFFPVTKKQVACSRKCSDDRRRDAKYFGGNRRGTIGLAEGVCQLCERSVQRGLSSHHLLGKENDPENEHLIALCQGCHKVVTMISARAFVDHAHSWENLITLVMSRRLSDRNSNELAVRACVDMEWLTADDMHSECLTPEVNEVLREWGKES